MRAIFVIPCGSCLIAEPGVTEAKLEEGFCRNLVGKTAHRLKEAKGLMMSMEAHVLIRLAQWHTRVHYLYANALPQAYFLRVDEWTALRGDLTRWATQPFPSSSWLQTK